MTLQELLRETRGFIVDLDGTTYLGGTLLPGAARFFETARELGRSWIFVTNNSSAAASDYVEKLARLGLRADPGQVMTSAEATAMHLSDCGYRRLYVVGTPALEREMRGSGFEVTADGADCVVLGFDTTLTYAKLQTAARLILAGVPFVATHPDLVCPTEDGPVPDCGAMIALLRAATGATPVVIGKPEPAMARMAMRRMGLAPERVAIIGDRLYTDMAMGRAAGTKTILVLSGETTRAMLASSGAPAPDAVVDGLDELAAALALASDGAASGGPIQTGAGRTT